MKFDKSQLLIYAVTDRAWTGKMSLYEQTEAALKGGATMVQLREKGLRDDNVEEYLHKGGYEVKQREGQGLGNWVLLDFGDLIVHVFDRENRLFYDLERIWSDGRTVEIDSL